MYNRSLYLTSVPHLSDKDLLVALWNTLKEDTPRIVIVSAYFDILDDSVVPGNLTQVMKFCADNNLPVIIGTDSNAHSVVWGYETNRRGEILEEWILNHNLAVANIGKKPTFVTTRASSCINATITSMGIICQGWKVESFLASDHELITFKVEGSSEPKWVRSLARANWVRFQRALDQTTWAPGFEWSQAMLHTEVSKLDTDIIAALDVVAPLKRLTTKLSAPWWSPALHDTWRKMSTGYNKWRQLGDSDSWESYVVLRRSYKSLVLKSKREA
eukprot:maker-scaffold296_size217904-snap-gene-0.11 protein:Tk03895 transcript:maker-scaffold296_size217904-snap-gene-0.11-mRNA-1 annotation:"lian-aa1 retrotransposon protein"